MANEFLDSLTKGGAGKEPASPYFLDNWKDKKTSGFGIPMSICILMSFLSLLVYVLEKYLLNSKTLTVVSNILEPYYNYCLYTAIVTAILAAIFIGLYIWDGKQTPHKHILINDFVWACTYQHLINSDTRNKSFQFKVDRNRKTHGAKIYFTIKSVEINETKLKNAFKNGQDGFTDCTYIAVELNNSNKHKSYKYVLILGFGHDFNPYGDDEYANQ